MCCAQGILCYMQYEKQFNTISLQNLGLCAVHSGKWDALCSRASALKPHSVYLLMVNIDGIRSQA